MALSQELLDILACPKCKGDLHLNDKQDGLVCSACRLEYPVRDDIPIMLIEEAKPIACPRRGPPARDENDRRDARPPVRMARSGRVPRRGRPLGHTGVAGRLQRLLSRGTPRPSRRRDLSARRLRSLSLCANLRNRIRTARSAATPSRAICFLHDRRILAD